MPTGARGREQGAQHRTQYGEVLRDWASATSPRLPGQGLRRTAWATPRIGSSPSCASTRSRPWPRRGVPAPIADHKDATPRPRPRRWPPGAGRRDLAERLAPHTAPRTATTPCASVRGGNRYRAARTAAPMPGARRGPRMPRRPPAGRLTGLPPRDGPARGRFRPLPRRAQRPAPRSASRRGAALSPFTKIVCRRPARRWPPWPSTSAVPHVRTLGGILLARPTRTPSPRPSPADGWTFSLSS